MWNQNDLKQKSYKHNSNLSRKKFPYTYKPAESYVFIFLVLLPSTSKNPVQPRSFKFCSLTTKNTKKSPLKNMREDEAYTIRNHSLESITCDDTEAYGCSNGSKKTFNIYISGSNVNTKTIYLKKQDIYKKYQS